MSISKLSVNKCDLHDISTLYQCFNVENDWMKHSLYNEPIVLTSYFTRSSNVINVKLFRMI